LWIECIPVYLPLPTPEPVEVDEVETGDAEVVTIRLSVPEGWDEMCWYTSNQTTHTIVDGHQANSPNTIENVNRIAAASANARKKREEAK
jgi:hypothetical protein